MPLQILASMQRSFRLLAASCLVLGVSIFSQGSVNADQAAPGAAGDAHPGAKVYAAQKCMMCHSIAGVGNKKLPLDSVGAKLTTDQIREWITHPVDAAAKAKSTIKPLMKAYPTLATADLDALTAYVASLGKSASPGKK
jgi:mono/diheme cytochrome c family protein